MGKKSLKAKLSQRLLKKRSRRRNSYNQRKMCRFCSNKDQATTLDYKNASLLRNFVTDRGKILPSRISGACAHHQRLLSNEIKKARVMALVPYTAVQM